MYWVGSKLTVNEGKIKTIDNILTLMFSFLTNQTSHIRIVNSHRRLIDDSFM